MGTKAKYTGRNLGFYDPLYNAAFARGVWANCPILAINQDPSIAHVFMDHFHSQPSTKAAQQGAWTIIEDDDAAGTDGVLDTAGGWYKHYADDGSDDDEAYMFVTGEGFKLASGKPLWYETNIIWTNNASTDGNFICGIMETGGKTDTLQNAEAGPLADYDGFCFYKLKTETSVTFESSIATDQVPSTLDDFVSGAAMRLGAYWDGVGIITPYFDGVKGTPHILADTGIEARICMGCKTDGTGEDNWTVDYVKVVQIR